MSRDISEHRKNLLDALVLAGRENSNAAVMFHTAVAAHLGLGASEEKTLDLLQRHGPLTAGEIVKLTGLAPASVTGLLDRLEAKWFVRRVRDPRDRRRVIVELNAEMLSGGDEIFEPLVSGLAELYAGYTDEQLELILDFLSRATAIQVEATSKIS
ncbi:MarR family winged helix-turn-helix transcriptional regulator [Nonomuraea soli]|uniref:DNA-binding MarR family transcriptional regulator n=1 Tax=Nonomuraea soli TaxID=1032476 RepID=A0A7W0CIT9_9ACTN|nr:MarR family transcriptional regulator [Nonomuraea soli]MBA2891946.1 DNA-binding MarR family transcriptional regulator [Nonomuraea soli]